MDLSSCVAGLAALDPACGDRAAAADALRRVSRLRALLDAIEIRWNLRLEELTADDPGINPEAVNAEATRRTLRAATRATRRARRSLDVPALSDALATGDISGEHLDAFTDAVRSLDPPLRPRLLELQAELVRVAAHTTVDEFRDRLRAEVRDIEGDDGRERLARQKRSNGVRTWTGKDGMWNLHGRFDPESALPMIEALRRATESIFHGEHPTDGPQDPLLRQQWIQAHALRELMLRTGARAGEPEFVVVIDEHTLRTGRRHECTRLDCGRGIELPIETIRGFASRARLVPVIVDRDGVVISVGGAVRTPEQLFADLRVQQLDHGRRRRHASRRQWRALRAMYRSCAIPGCDAHVSRCEAHHVEFWEHGGATDLRNLVPLCRHHHDRLHAEGWQLDLRVDRSLVLRRNGEVIMSTGPPRVQWA